MLPAREVEGFRPAPSAVLLSIRDPGTYPPSWPSGAYVDVLELEFEDVTPEECVLGGYELFSERHARGILAFAKAQGADVA